MWRDLFFLGKHWWVLTTESMLVDIYACRGESGTDEFDTLWRAYQETRGGLALLRDFPPFTPRYAWLDKERPVALDAVQSEYRTWVATTKKLSCMHIHTDLLISYGDFLRYGLQAETRARVKYREALATAEQHGYKLFQQVAQERLASSGSSFPGLINAQR